MRTGTIKNVHLDRGFGFIKPDGAGPDLFFHCKQISGLEWGPQLVQQRVRFVVIVDELSGKNRAVDVAAEV